MNGAPELSVVLPTLDEADGLRVLLPRIAAAFAAVGVRGEVLVVDGGSKDGTEEIARSGGARVIRQRNRGFGSAVREGLLAASAPWVLIMDADGSHPPEDIPKFWARRHEAELIVGSRYCAGGSAEMPLSRHVLSRSLNAVAGRVLELPAFDSSSGFRLYKDPKRAASESAATDFSVQQDLMARVLASGGRVAEQPFHYAPRVGGKSKADALRLAPAYVRMLARLKALRGGWRAEAGLGLALAAALAAGLCGIGGGLPGPERLRALPPEAPRAEGFARRLADAWAELYRRIDAAHASKGGYPDLHPKGAAELAPGWTFPPEPLLAPARALLTQSINPDEKKSFIILGRMRPWKLELEPLYVHYGGAFIYPLGAFLAAAKALGLATLAPDLAVYLADPAAMGRLYLLGRVHVLLFHLAGIFVLYELGRRLSGRRTAAAAALLWTLTPLALVNSHIVKPHPVSAFWALGAALFALKAFDDERAQDHLLCGLFAGMAAGGSLTLVPGLALPLLARLLAGRGSWKPALLGAAAGGAAVALTNPYLFLMPGRYAWELTVYSPAAFALPPRAVAGFLSGPVPEGLGAALGALALAACVRGLFSDRHRRLLALTALGGGLFLLARFSALAEGTGALRLFMPLAALGVLLAADLAASLPRSAGALLLALCFADTGLRGSVYLENLAREAGRSTRAEAADWIDANVPAGARLGLTRWPEPPFTPPFRWDRLRLVAFSDAAAVRARPPEWIAAAERDWARVDSSLRGLYDEARRFPAARRLWASPRDDGFYANAEMLVLKRKGP